MAAVLSSLAPTTRRQQHVFDGWGARAGTLTKLLLRLRQLQGQAPHRMAAEAMLFVAAILRLGESPQMAHPIDADSMDRMVTCLQVQSLLLHHHATRSERPER